MATKIISAFPGTGKSYCASRSGQAAHIVDLDSGDYTQGYTADGKVRNPDFPGNYVAAIKDRIGSVDLLLISCQPETIIALQKEKLPFTLVYPERKLKAEYMKRFRQRGSPQPFIRLISKNWDGFLEFLESQQASEHIVLASGQYIADAIACYTAAMGTHTEQAELAKEVERAKSKIDIGAKYWHHKDPGKLYKVTGLGFLEATDELCVIYRAEYGEMLTFVRPLAVWHENVEWEGKTVPRFNKVENE